MKYLNILIPFAFTAIFLILSSAIPPQKGCHKINAKGEGSIVSMAGPEVITEAHIIGGGLLNGKTWAVFHFVSEEGFIGKLDLVTKHGSIQFVINDGQFTGDQFRATAIAVSGSGKLAGASGSLVLEGVSEANGDFTEKISGEICFDSKFGFSGK